MTLRSDRRIAELLADPLTLMVMQADRVDSRALAAELGALARRLDSAKRQGEAASDAKRSRDRAATGAHLSAPYAAAGPRRASALCGACCP